MSLSTPRGLRMIPPAVAGLSWVLLVVAISWGEPTAPSARERYITLELLTLLQREHISRRTFDDELANRAIEQLLQMLDPWKVYFYEADVASFRAQAQTLDDALRKGDLRFPFELYKIMAQRVDERLAVAEELLQIDHDFTVEEEILRDRKLQQFPKDPAEARERWRQRIKYELLTLKAEGTEGPAARDKLARRYRSFAKRIHQMDNEELVELFLTAVCSAYDPHSSYMSPSTLENFQISMRLNLEGIGASLQAEDGYTVVREIVPGGAAARDGRLKVGDRIIGVGQGPDGEIEDVVDMRLTDVVKRIRGPKGTIVRLKVVSPDNPEPRIIDITRDRIELREGEAQSAVFEMGQKPDGSPYRIGVIDLPSFYMDMEGARAGLPNYKSSTRDVARILTDFNLTGVDAVVLDLRRNGGGSLQEALALTGLFIDEGPLLQVKDAAGRIQPHYDTDGQSLWKGPLVVVISKFSASASEILAGAIQDYRRGLIVGDPATHGKGTVQSLMELGQLLSPFNPLNLGAAKITVQKFYRPSGDSTQNRGVLSDIQLPSLSAHLDVAESDLDYALEFDRVPPLEFRRYDMVNPAIVAELTRRSRERIAQSPEFQRDQQQIDRYLARKARKTISLNEEKFLAERKALEAEEQEEKLLQSMEETHRRSIKRDHYLNEVLNITLDYMTLQLIAQRN
ncbi:MAG: carboxy terminal-processing peptidase [Thermoguttaceae bacterium]|nr:carboxy terminal-processing peptidase [Thermoguttaceae bacterium]MDW8080054.1 carboxy terminal-processing peptidase [Thermoguttaceae bacterium]